MTKLVALFALAVAAPAFAGGSPQTHHCEKDGKEVKMTHKECTKAGGTWAKGAPAGEGAAKDAPAKDAPAKDAPAPTPAPAPAK
jgi:hypothetical protein